MYEKVGVRIGIVGLGVILSLAGAANAVLLLDLRTLEIAVGERLSVTVWSDTCDPYTGYLELRAEGLGRWYGPMVVFSLAGADAWADDLGDEGQPGWWRLEAASADPAGPIMAGPHFQIDYYASEPHPGIVEIVLRDSTKAILGVAEINQDIPEPGAAVMLLGLASIAVRWKRRVG